MNCHKHSKITSVSQCIDCGRGLCPECTNKYSVPICDSCNYNRAENDQKVALRNLLLMVAFFVFGFYVSSSAGKPLLENLFSGYVFAGIPWGWNILTMITPQVFLILPGVGWLIYFFIKFCIAALIGWLVTPFKIYQYMKKYINAEKFKTDLSA